MVGIFTIFVVIILNSVIMIQINEVYDILFHNKRVEISKEEKDRVDESFQFLTNFAKDKVIYGINTGFGPMAQYRINDDDLNALQYNIIRSHSSGAGNPFSQIYVKAAMFARLQTFLQGKSGVHVRTVEIIEEFINRGIYPFIPEHGSVGASGDLVQLAHMALAIIGEGEVFYKGELRSTAEVLKAENIEPLVPYLREGLALVNGTAMMTGVGLVNLIYAKKLLSYALLASVWVNEIVASYDDFLADELNRIKNHEGQIEVARIMRELSKGGNAMLKREADMYHKHRESVFQHKVQPYYSLRCVPQILGPIMDTLNFSEQVLIEELNSADDNPIVDFETNMVYHGGNFHGDYVSFEMDKMKIAITKLTMLMERQMNYIFHDRINEILPPFVNLGELGLNYGMQAMQFTATSTTAECQTLSNPMYVHSIPNNNDNQDVVSMGTNSALIARHVIDNSFQVMAIHLIALTQAVDCLKISSRLAPATRKMYEEIRNIVPIFVDDTPKYKDIDHVVNFLKTNEFNLV